MLGNLINLVLNVLKSSSNTSAPAVNPPVEAPKHMAITLDAYFTDSKTGEDRRIKYASDYTPQILENAKALLEKVNTLLTDLGAITAIVNSGFRPPSVNVAIGGAKNSAHCTGEAVDIADKTGSFKEQILNRIDLLEKHDLYMEDRSATPSWCHLQTRKTKSGHRIFKP